jgi:quercetin dioxygenase-like cupin family protein
MLCNHVQRPSIGVALITKEAVMNGSRWLVALVGIVALGVGFGLGSAVGQQNPPMDNKGLDAKVESTIDLAPDMPGYQLRLRTITFEPGGVAGFHSHKQRPAFAYVMQGNLTELRQGGYEKLVGPGGVITESRDVEHWAENRGGSKVVLIGVDIVKP